MLKTLPFLYLLIFPILLNFFLIIMMTSPPSKNYNDHPLFLLLNLMIVIFLISNQMNMLYYSWMPYFLFLTMIGGLMIMFMYITSLSNNMIFSFSLKFFIINLIKITPMIMLMTMFSMKMLPLNPLMNFNNQDSWEINFYLINMQDELNINIIFDKINFKSTLFIMMYLYLTMICIMNICYKLKAPLRKLIN